MKFKFELDDVDTENFFTLFQREQNRIISTMLDAVVEQREPLACWMRGYITAVLNLDALAVKVHPRLTLHGHELMQPHIDVYGVNVYDVDGNYRGYQLNGVFHES
jgi:hypothetical protein